MPDPFRPAARERRSHQAEVAARAVGGLQVVDAREPGAVEAPGDRHHASTRATDGPVVDPDLVEQPVQRASPSSEGDGHEGEMRVRVVGTDRGHGAVRQDEVAERAELDDEDTGTVAHGCLSERSRRPSGSDVRGRGGGGLEHLGIDRKGLGAHLLPGEAAADARMASAARR